ncbi:MAG TPA: peptidoglycan DD-metalloendopeptidase family protein [Chitinophagaceae bacterium]|nr:peptidoglycan DD-metalloendopeptidase family protein [Chitinophagaceae bacterium]
MRKKVLLPFIIFCSLSLLSKAQPQDRSELEKERQAIQQELKEIQGMYNKVKGQTKQTLGQLNVLNRKISLQEQYINNISKEIRSIDDDIYLSNIEIYRLQKQLDTLKTQYARTVVYAYKNKSNYDYLNFIFSASSFNDAIKRITYLKSYRSYREKQVNTILETQDLIAKRKKQQLGRKDQKNTALGNQTKQVKELEVQKKEKATVVADLKSKEKDLSSQIAVKKKRDKDLNNAIAAIVRREIEAAKAKAKAEAEAKRKADELAKKNNPTAPEVNTGTTTTTAAPGSTTSKRNEAVKKPASYLDLNAKDVALNSSFAANRAKLPWPVDNGVVTLRYGNNKIENTLLTFDNPGITIATPSSGVAVKAVFDGEVAAVYSMGDGTAVTIRHGKYFTTYSNLSGVSVSKGASVKTGQQIGRAGKDDDGNGGQIDFILMIETKNVDPLPWLRR